MKIENHYLIADDSALVKISEIDGRAGPEIVPELIVIHYAVTHSLDATVRAQQARGYLAHASTDGYHDGKRSVMRVVQQLPFNRRGAHAGRSSWRGRKACNGYSIGIEIANPGPLIRGDDGKLRTVYGKVWPEMESVYSGPVAGYPSSWQRWAEYTPEEMGILAALCRALVAEYRIKEIVGHSDVSPGRKFDPGPAFQMDWLRQAVFNGRQNGYPEPVSPPLNPCSA